MDFFFFAAVDGRFVPTGALPWGVCPPGVTSLSCGAVPARSWAPSLLLELNGVVAVADVGLLGGQCCKETQSSGGSSAAVTFPSWLLSRPPDPARRCQQGCDRVCSGIWHLGSFPEPHSSCGCFQRIFQPKESPQDVP